MKKKVVFLLLFIVGITIQILGMNRYIKKCMIKSLLISNKNLKSFDIMNRWVRMKQEGKNLSEYFEQAGYKKIAIYGMGHIGETLQNELNCTKTEVLYGIDQRSDTTYSNIDIISLKDELQPVDAIVVTLVNEFESISEKINERINCPVISIVDVVYDI